MTHVLLVDDEKNLLEVMSYQLRELGYVVYVSSSVDIALQILEKKSVDIIITDLKMPNRDGIDLIKSVKKLNGLIKIVVMTAFASIDTTVAAMKLGAADYITKPVNIDEIDLCIKKLLHNKFLEEENSTLRRKLGQEIRFDDIPGFSPLFRQSLEMAHRIATTDIAVLVCGESGTGKELVARAIHYGSNRQKNNFVAHNCAALTAELFDSEIFGYRKGAFTGAVQDKKGLIEQAEGGTLFLDEIGELSDSLQAKLLRLLENGTYRRVGDTQERKSNIRLICATNKNLSERVKQGLFREDFYYRINVITIEIPPLRNRREDIELLAKLFLQEADPTGKRYFTDSFINKLVMYDFPGNVRELKNVIYRASALSEEVIDSNFLSDSLLKSSVKCEKESAHYNEDVLDFSKKRFDLERYQWELVQKALLHFNNNITRTAKFLALPRHKLVYMMKKMKRHE